MTEPQFSFASLEPPSRPVPSSQQAAREIAPKLDRLEAAVLSALRTFGAMGPDRCAGLIGEPWISIRPRFSELDARGVLEKVPGVFGVSAFGKKQSIWGIV